MLNLKLIWKKKTSEKFLERLISKGKRMNCRVLDRNTEQAYRNRKYGDVLQWGVLKINNVYNNVFRI